MKHFNFEEDFHARENRHYRKEKKAAPSGGSSKEGPLQRGRIVAITGEGSWIDSEGKQYLCSLKGVLKREKTTAKNLIAVGDWVHIALSSDTEGTIVRIEERYSSLARTDITGKKEQLIAVNIDQVVIVVSVGDPPLKPSLVDRYLIAAEKGKLHPIIAINKIDLLEGEEASLYRDFLSAYEPLGYPILSLSRATGVGIQALCSLLHNKTSVFSGQSGVGKSSLLNVCFGLSLKVGALAQKTYKGTHTTTTAELLPLPGGGYCVDTPGIRSFGLWNIHKDDVMSHFTEFHPWATSCKFPDCTHLNEPQCGVLQALADGKIARLRYESYQVLLREAMSGSDKMTWG